VKARLHRSETDSHRSWLAPVVAVSLAVIMAAGGTGVVLAADHGNTPGRHHQDSPPNVQQPPPPALRVVSVTPSAGAKVNRYKPPIVVTVSNRLAAGSPMPSISPRVAGSWSEHAKTLVFQPTANFLPYSTVSVTVPGGRRGLLDGFGQRLAQSTHVSFTLGGPSVLRLQQVLAELGYLPLSFRQPHSLRSEISLEAGQPRQVRLAAVGGTFAWRYANIPASLASEWVPGVLTPMVTGAVMAFETNHGLADDGVAGQHVWANLVADLAARSRTSAPYNYITVSESLPETLSVWQDGNYVFSAPANTGIASAPTALGTYPVYVRELVGTMSGTNPDGSHYSDPGIPNIAYFNGGDAVHGFLRPGYGYPQSLGCVELSFADAATAWNYDQIGTLVTVV
jgi:peptidoglycan hydrolase-like protein with peptidoglycan-binding domain